MSFTPIPGQQVQAHGKSSSCAEEHDPDSLQPARQAANPRNKVLLTTAVPDQQTAWTKARMDARCIMKDAGYSTLQLPTTGRLGEWLSLAAALKRLLSKGGHILIEYPFDQRKRAYVLHLLSAFTGAKLYALIHDLNSVRYDDSPRGREVAILKLFDGLISHNPTMTRFLRDGGVRRKMVELNLFDYCTGPARTWHERGMSSPLKVVCASNLTFDKAGYVYDQRLGELRNVQLSVYGAFFEPERMPSSAVTYKGVFDANAPVLDGNYHFGLVWDGSGVENCEGKYGHYMRFNNPHKLSLYVSLGLPVVVWREAAVAEFVLGQGIGVTVNDLRELSGLPGRVDNAAYRTMAENVVRLSHEVKRGAFLRNALDRLVEERVPSPA